MLTFFLALSHSLPGTKVVLKLAACFPSVGPLSLVLNEVGRNLFAIMFDYSELSEGLPQDDSFCFAYHGIHSG